MLSVYTTIITQICIIIHIYIEYCCIYFCVFLEISIYSYLQAVTCHYVLMLIEVFKSSLVPRPSPSSAPCALRVIIKCGGVKTEAIQVYVRASTYIEYCCIYFCVFLEISIATYLQAVTCHYVLMLIEVFKSTYAYMYQ